MFVIPLYLGVVVALFLVLPILIGVYVYKDATSRNMNAAMWTLIAVLAPAAIGLIVYLIVRSDYNAYQCPNCKTPVNEGFDSCPKCGTSLKAKCAKCGNVLSPGWQNCAHCGEPVPVGTKAAVLPTRKDTGLGKILIVVILIPVLIISALFVGLMTFRTSHPTSIGSVDGMRIEDFSDNKVVSDWLKYCNTSGTGIYVLEYQYPQNQSDNLRRSNYIVYRNGLSKDVNVAAVGGFQGFFKESLKIEYEDAEITGVADYHIYQVDYSSTDNTQLEIFVNGQKADYKITKSNEPIMFLQPYWWRNDAANLYKLRLDYVGDNSGVSRLVEETGLAFIGDYTLELKTSEKPYGLKIKYSNTAKPPEIVDFSPNATELLGLIKNLDYVEIIYGSNSYKLTADEASAALGYDVKEFGTNPQRLEDYLKARYGDSYLD